MLSGSFLQCTSASVGDAEDSVHVARAGDEGDEGEQMRGKQWEALGVIFGSR